MPYPVQISKEMYDTKSYMYPGRWSTHALVVFKILELKPEKILEIGPGNGLVSDILRSSGFSVKTLDYDSNLHPDFVMDVSTISPAKLNNERFDLILASEVFEHIKYEDFKTSLTALKSVTNTLLITVPYERMSSFFFYFLMKIPFFKTLSWAFKLRFKPAPNRFNGQHYWEIGKQGYSLRRLRRDLRAAGWKIQQDFFNPDNPYHYFFILVNDSKL